MNRFPLRSPSRKTRGRPARKSKPATLSRIAVRTRTTPTNPTLKLCAEEEPAPFGKTLDSIGKDTGIAFSAYQPDGGVALVDKPYRELKTHYSGPFRFAVKRVAVSRDDETQAHTCQVTLDAAWEPLLQVASI